LSFEEYEFLLQEITATITLPDGSRKYMPVEKAEDFIQKLGNGFKIRTIID
jgi:hypothetical protein